MSVTLDSATVEAIALRVAELIGNTDTTACKLIDAAEVAHRFNVSREYVYEHATELGAVRLGDGPKARLRFSPERVVEALSPQPFAPTTGQPSRRRQRRKASSVELLPVGPRPNSERKKEPR